MISKWVEEELESIDIGDKRLNNRVKYLLHAASKQPSVSICSMFHTRKEVQAAYRLYDNDLVTEQKIFKPHFQKTCERIYEHSVVLNLCDTTSLNYTSRKKQPDSGYISSNNALGFFLHLGLAITPDRLHLGVTQQKFWAREKVKPEKKVHRDSLPIEEKESFRWLQSYINSCEIAEQCKNTQIVHISDREGDIIEIFSEYQSRKNLGTAAEFIIRSNHNRIIGSGKETKKLYDHLSDIENLGLINFEAIDRVTDKTRKVRQSVKAASVLIKSKEKNKPDVPVNVICLEEIDPPIGEEPIVWYLLTSLPISSLEEILTIIKYYLARWEIEVFFKTYKSGCKIEEKSLRKAKRLYPLFSLLLIVAWRLNFLLHMNRIMPEISCDAFFEESEWKAGYIAATREREAPPAPPTLGQMIMYIAMLGGYLGRKNDPQPGIKLLWLGISALYNYADAWELFGPGANTK